MERKIILITVALFSIITKSFAYVGETFDAGYSGMEFMVTAISPQRTVTVYQKNYSSDLGTNLIIPETVEGPDGNTYSVTSIADNGFRQNGSFTYVTIPKSVETIGQYAFFANNKLTTVSGGQNVKTIGQGAFSGSGITSFPWNNVLETIGEGAFGNCSSLISVKLPSSVKSIGVGAFQRCGIGRIEIPYGIKKIEQSCFYGCTNLSTVTIPETVTEICAGAFAKTKIYDLTLPYSIQYIRSQAFEDVSPNTISLENAIPPTLASDAFNTFTATLEVPLHCSSAYQSATTWKKFSTIKETLYYGVNYVFTENVDNTDFVFKVTSVDGFSSKVSVGSGEFSSDYNYFEEVMIIPQSFTIKDGYNYRFRVTGIEKGAFYSNVLKSVTIPSSVVSIGNYAFQSCTKLKDVYVERPTPPSIEKYSFESLSTKTLHVPIGSKASYQAADYWKEWQTIVEDITSDLIVFADTKVKALCVENWDTNGDEELSYDEAAAVKGLGDVFDGIKSITSFNELLFFTSLTRIENYAFYGCSGLTSIEIPNSVTSIGNNAFEGCSGLTSIGIPNSVTNIGSEVFYECSSLTSIGIPNSVTSIGNNAFYGCSGLTSITVVDGNNIYDSRGNCNAIIETASNSLLLGCKSTIIPNSVTSIGNWAFSSCSGLTSIEIPNSVTSIGDYAFDCCSGLTSINIPNSVTSIGSDAFYGCSGLTSVTIPNSVTSIGNYAFYGCSGLTSVTVKKTVPVSITSYVFSNRSNATLYVPDGSKAAYEAANYWKEFKKIVELPSPAIVFADANVKALCVANWDTNGDSELSEAEAAVVTDLGEVFKGNKNINSFEELHYFVGLTSIGNYAFESCSGLTSITIPNSVTSIGELAFYYCSGLTSITIPNSVTSIGVQAFYVCSGLTSITIPNSVTSIGRSAFSGCKGLTSIKVESGNTKYDSRDNCNAIIETESNTLISGCKNTTIPNSVTSIGSSAFFNCRGLTSITIPNSVTSIGSSAFRYCSGLTSITIPNSVTSIGEWAFYECRGLTSITIGNSVTSIGSLAFYYCSGLTSITIPNSVTSIGNDAFERCSGLTSITIPNSVTSIGKGAFQVCSGLTSITIPNSVTSIGSYAFSGCSGLTSIKVESGNTKYDSRDNCNAIIETESNTLISGCKNTTIPNSVTSIGSYAFSGCSGLTSITIPNSVTSIGEWAFESCSGLTSVTIPNSVTSIENGAFNNCSGLTSVTVKNPVPVSIIFNVFSNRSNATLYVPVGSKTAYEAADYWKEFKEIIETGSDSQSGDLNGDGIINGIDLVAQTNLIMTDQYNAAADLNNDGVVNGLDYVMMVNLIMSFTSAPTMEAPTSNRAASTASLSIEDFDIKAGETKEMFINLSNPDNELTLLQFDMSLPEGLSIAVEDGDYAIDIAGRTTWKRHSLIAKAIDGTTRFLLASNTNALIDGDNGNVISIKLTASKDFKCGDIKFENQLLVSPDAEDVMPADYIYYVGDATSIDGITAGEAVDVYTLTGSKVRHAATSLDGLPKGVYIIKGKKVIVK